MSEKPLLAALQAGALELGVPLGADQTTRLLDYLALLGKWGRVYNLTAVHNPQDMLNLHVLDSLSLVAPLLLQLRQRGLYGRVRLLDVGAGAGLPGVVLAVCCPLLDVTCVDAVAKKAAFVTQVAAALRLPNLQGVHVRAEKLAGMYDVVASRAFAALADMVRCTDHVLAADGLWVAMKGKPPTLEMAALQPQVHVFHVEPVQVPGLQAQRCLVWMERAAPS